MRASAPESIGPFSYRSRRLHLQERPVQDWVRELGTPFFLVDENRLKSNYRALADGFSDSGSLFRIRYCAKANNEAGILTALSECGSHALASYPEEVQLLLACGFPPERLAYQRPVLTDEEVRVVMEAGVTYFHVYRSTDLNVLERQASIIQRPLHISLRIRNDVWSSRLSILNFLSRRLGFSAADVLPAVEQICRSTVMRLSSINFYCGTQRESPGSYRALLRKAFRLAAAIRARFGVDLEEINLGGGVPSASLGRVRLKSLRRRLRDDGSGVDHSVALPRFARELAALFLEEARTTPYLPAPALGLEPGRSIVGNAVFLITRIRAVQGNWVFLDASRNFLDESPLIFSRRLLPIEEKARTRFYHISGNTLNTRDVIDYFRRLPSASEGDILVICDAGAYTISKARRYAGLAPEVYLLRQSGALDLIRRREGLEELRAQMISREKELADRGA